MDIRVGYCREHQRDEVILCLPHGEREHLPLPAVLACQPGADAGDARPVWVHVNILEGWATRQPG
jgi:hypothetical protein